jgi:CRP-like cAMP-binding protein
MNPPFVTTNSPSGWFQVRRLVYQLFMPGEYLFRQGDPAEEFFILIDGHLSAGSQGGDRISEPYQRYAAGRYFGHLEGLRSATAGEAEQKTKTITLQIKSGKQSNKVEKKHRTNDEQIPEISSKQTKTNSEQYHCT